MRFCFWSTTYKSICYVGISLMWLETASADATCATFSAATLRLEQSPTRCVTFARRSWLNAAYNIHPAPVKAANVVVRPAAFLVAAGPAICQQSSVVQLIRLDRSYPVNAVTFHFVQSCWKLQHSAGQSFPTPMEEPRKVLKAQYIGSLPVYRPSGMDVLNDAIDQMMNQVPRDQWRDVNVSVAPSVVTITDTDVSQLFDFRLGQFHFLLFSIGRGEDHRGIPRPFSVLLGHRTRRGDMRFHRPYSQRHFHRPRPLLLPFFGSHL